ncbi:MAG: hypothetical protein M1828_002718 [Chrysothrix sp. TS-e1954]|nr:MAG: hypothetical protein M1828_002718 [Chrysothrix sp. TS-e1954]
MAADRATKSSQDLKHESNFHKVTSLTGISRSHAAIQDRESTSSNEDTKVSSAGLLTASTQSYHRASQAPRHIHVVSRRATDNEHGAEVVIDPTVQPHASSKVATTSTQAGALKTPSHSSPTVQDTKCESLSATMAGLARRIDYDGNVETEVARPSKQRTLQIMVQRRGTELQNMSTDGYRALRLSSNKLRKKRKSNALGR